MFPVEDGINFGNEGWVGPKHHLVIMEGERLRFTERAPNLATLLVEVMETRKSVLRMKPLRGTVALVQTEDLSDNLEPNEDPRWENSEPLGR